MLKEIPKKNVGVMLTFKTEQSYAEEKVAEAEEFAVTACVKKFGGLEKSVRLHVNTTAFLEEDVKDCRVILKQSLASIMFIKIKRKGAGMNTLKLGLPHRVEYRCRLPTHELDYIVSNILHSLQTRDESDYYVPFIMLEPAELSTKVYGLGGDVDSAFENSLKKELEQATAQGDILDPRVRDLMFDAAFNANFKSSGFDAKFLALLFALLADMSQILFKLEGDPAALQALPELPAFQKQAETLIALSGSKNSVVAINAALALRSLLKVCGKDARVVE